MVKDFHFQSLHTAIEPLIIRMAPPQNEYLFARIDPGQSKEAIAGFESVSKKFNPNYPFELFYQDERFEQMYQSERSMGTLATLFALLAIFISCLGLLGLVSFSAQQRTKEIGIRKVLGASTPSLVTTLSKEFIKLVAVAFVLASPLAYYFMNDWLQDFAYRTSLGWGVFVFAGILSLIIACITVSSQTIKVALANPIESLRYE